MRKELQKRREGKVLGEKINFFNIFLKIKIFFEKIKGGGGVAWPK